MQSFTGFIEIGQDAAAVIESGSTNAAGVYTAGIQSCMIVAFECTDALVVVHDSAQLAFSEITALVGQNGRCQRLTAIYPAGVGIHADRLNRLKLVTGVKEPKFLKVPVQANDFAVAISVDGDYQVLPNGVATGYTELPDKQVRTSVTELNNFFIKPNSKSMKVDVQYAGGKYNPRRGTDKTVDQMLDTTDQQPKFFFNNAALIYAAHQLGVVNTPEYLLRLVERFGIQRYRTDSVAPADYPIQALAFEEYRSARAR